MYTILRIWEKYDVLAKLAIYGEVGLSLVYISHFKEIYRKNSSVFKIWLFSGFLLYYLDRYPLQLNEISKVNFWP